MDALISHDSPHQIGILSCEVILFASIAFVTKGPEILIFGLPTPVSRDFVINMQFDFVFGRSPSAHLAGTVIPPEDACAQTLADRLSVQRNFALTDVSVSDVTTPA
jgi:hypothetical protein